MTTPRPVSPPFDRIIFDCDSTLSRIEGIDELAGEHKEEIATLTRRAMSGEIPLQDVYGKRLEILTPTRNQVATVGRLYIEQVTPGAKELLGALRSLGKEIVIVSGGLRLAVVAFAQWLGLRDEDVHAVKIFFDGEGRYRGFDESSPLTRSGGKRSLLGDLPKGARTAFVGDGMTDAEARDKVDTFIFFGGVAPRAEVESLADASVTTENLIPLIPLLCSKEERDLLSRDPRHRDLLQHFEGTP